MLKTILAIVSLASLIFCFALPFFHLDGGITLDEYKNYLLAGTLAWFVVATWWMAEARKRRP